MQLLGAARERSIEILVNVTNTKVAMLLQLMGEKKIYFQILKERRKVGETRL